MQVVRTFSPDPAGQVEAILWLLRELVPGLRSQAESSPEASARGASRETLVEDDTHMPDWATVEEEP